MSPDQPKKLCAWLSRHPPSAAQRHSLERYRIVQLPERWQSAEAAWECVQERCAGRPALAVVVMPEAMLCTFILLADGTKVIRPRMALLDHSHWTGRWQRVYVYPKLGYRSWEPEIRKGK